MAERLRELERAHRADPQDLVALRELADERKRRGEELLPDRVTELRGTPWIVRVTSLATSLHALSGALARAPSPSAIFGRSWTYEECLAIVLDFEGPPRWPDDPALLVSVDRDGIHGRPRGAAFGASAPWIDPINEAWRRDGDAFLLGGQLVDPDRVSS
jgi:hypothetical protein